MNRNQPAYRMSFSVGGLMLTESLFVAQVYKHSEMWAQAKRRILLQGASSMPKVASRTRVLREVYDRLSQLTEGELEYLVASADRQEQQALLWLSSCRLYRFVREFAVEVVNDRYRSWRLELGPPAFDRFFAERVEVSAELAALSASTVAKLRQNLFRILREADVLGANGQIQPLWLSNKLKELITETDSGDLRVFPGEGG